jgi:hypothetical protein
LRAQSAAKISARSLVGVNVASSRLHPRSLFPETPGATVKVAMLTPRAWIPQVSRSAQYFEMQ